MGVTDDGPKVCLDLFCGLCGFSAAFADADDWQVVTVDVDPAFDPDHCADVLDLRPADVLAMLPVESWADLGTFVILASPPCTEFSIAASRYEKIVDGDPQTPAAREAVTLAHHTFGLVQGCAPDYWWVENPQGYMRQFVGDPDARVTFFQYGEDYMKPTDLWGEFPASWTPRRCTYGDDCHAYNTDQDHGGLGNCAVMDDGKAKSQFQQTTGSGQAAERAKVPYALSASIREAVDNPDPLETLDRW